jgi:hypothetical protein
MHDRLHLSTIILARWWRPVASTKALDLLHWAMCVVWYRRTAAAIKTASKVGVFVDCCLFACCPGASSRPMAASSGFQSSPGHAASGDAVCIAPAYPRGHQNGQQGRCIHFLPPLFLLAIIIAKDHVMVH